MSTQEPSEAHTPDPHTEPQPADANRKNLTTILAVLGVLAVLVIGVVAYNMLTNKDDDKTLTDAAASSAASVSDQSAGAATPVTTAASGTTAAGAKQPGPLVQGGFQTGQNNAPVTVEIYEDYMCPACRSFEAQNMAQLEQWTNEGKIKVIHKPVAILNQYSQGTMYPTRAVNAAAAVFTHAGPQAFYAYHIQLMAKQPPEGTGGLTDDQLIALLRDAKVPAKSLPAIEKAIKSKQYAGWVDSSTREFLGFIPKDADGKSPQGAGTPTVLVNGVWTGPQQDLAGAVERASKK